MWTGLKTAVSMSPPGFSVQLFAEGVGKARMMAFSPDGVLHVVSMTPRRPNNQWSPDPSRTASTILALPDRDKDGVADEVRVVAEGFWWPNGLAFYDGYLYVGDTHELVRLKDNDNDGFYEEREVLVPLATWIPGLGGAEHVTHTIAVDRVNDKLYVHQGSSCDLCRETDPERATILEFNPDGSGRRIFARGLRNSIGMAFHPVTNQLWATNNGHDRDRFPGGRDLPPEWIGIVREGGFYGWPLAHGYQVWVDFEQEEYRNSIFPISAADSADVASMTQPVATVAAHTAPMAIHFYTGDQFGTNYKNAAFFALRAGTRGNTEGHKVMVLFSEADGSNAQVADFLTGFRPNPSSDNVWGKPVGITTDSEGHLYVSSDHITQAIFRVTQDAATAVSEEFQEAEPQTFSLAQNLPNPFNSTTIIGFALPTQTQVELAIYNLAGQKVTTLVEGARRAGNYTLSWDGRDSQGKDQASGVYFYRLRAGHHTQLKKLLLLR